MIKSRIKNVRNHSTRIARRIEQRKAEILNQFGTDTRDIAIDSMRVVSGDSQATSPAGRPPYVRSGQPNMTTIRHELKPGMKGVRVGVVRATCLPYFALDRTGPSLAGFHLKGRP